jgi:hypothetical protein
MSQKEFVLQTKKNIPWINNVKALCMLIVFLFHSEWYLEYDLSIVDSFYTPFFINSFFFLSGYLLFRKQLTMHTVKESLRDYLQGGGKILLSNNLFRIAIPTVLFSLIEFFPKKIIRGEGIVFSDMFVETIGGCTFWFTSALFVSEVLLLILLLTRHRKIWFYFILSLAIACIGVYFRENSLYLLGNEFFPWFYARGMVAIAYITVGGLFWKYEDDINNGLKRCNNLIVIFLLMTIFILLIWVCNTLESEIIKTIFVFIRNCVGVFFIVRVCMMMRENKWFSFIGVNSLGFYLLSGAVPNIYCILFNRLFNLPKIITLITVVIFSIVTVYVIMLVLSKYAPWLFDLRLIRRNKDV